MSQQQMFGQFAMLQQQQQMLMAQQQQGAQQLALAQQQAQLKSRVAQNMAPRQGGRGPSRRGSAPSSSGDGPYQNDAMNEAYKSMVSKQATNVRSRNADEVSGASDLDAAKMLGTAARPKAALPISCRPRPGRLLPPSALARHGRGRVMPPPATPSPPIPNPAHPRAQLAWRGAPSETARSGSRRWPPAAPVSLRRASRVAAALKETRSQNE